MAYAKKEKKADKTVGEKVKGEKSIIDSTLREIQGKFGEGAIMRLGDSPKIDIGVVNTGSIGLDEA
jgi:recombination protein RecA